jgi:2-polyprenyl-6-methoxyphenol hydroxylase-like FAD-dependent oxidoreductase
MHAVLFKRHGHNVHILEAASSARASHAAGITARDDVLEYMRLYDLTEEPWYINSPDTQFINKSGARIRGFKKVLCMTSWSVLYHRLRANFDGLESVFVKNVPRKVENEGRAVFEVGVKVVGVVDVGKEVEVRVKDGDGDKERTMRADLVIAADGSNSFIRHKMLPEVQTKYSGYVAFRGCVPQNAVSEKTLATFIDQLTIFKGSNPKSYILL